MNRSRGTEMAMLWRGLALLVLLLTWLAVPGAAHEAKAPTLVLSGAASHHRLGGHLEILHDPAAELAPGQAAAAAFTPRPIEAVERNYTTGAVWYRFTLLRPPGVPGTWVLAMGEPFIDDIRVFLPAPEGGLHEQRLGRAVPNMALPLAARRHVLRLDLPEAVPVPVLVRLASHDEIQFQADLWQPDALLFEEVRSATVIGMFLTLLLVIGAVYALFGASLRDGPMLGYAAYLFSFVLFGSAHTGVLAILLPHVGGSLFNLLAATGVLGNVAALLFMWDRVLDLTRSHPQADRLYMAACALALVLILAAPTPLFIHLVRPSFVATLVVTLASLALGLHLLGRDPRNGLVRSYVIAFVPFLVFAALHAAEAFFPSALDILLVRQVGTLAILVHILILAMALAQRIGQMQGERLRSEKLAAAHAETQRALAGEQVARQRLRMFLDMASHEFKTPLAVIDSAAQFLELNQDRPEFRTRVTTIRRAVQRLVGLIETCLVGERDQDLVLKRRSVAPAALVEVAAERHRHMGGPEPVVSLGVLPEGVEVDPDLLGIALDALMDNARRYGGPGQPVELSAEAEQDRILIRVADRGPGVPAESVERIFEKYYRCPSSEGVPGTGIGLHLVRTVAELHGGGVAYEPRPGGGACFIVSLPLARPPIPEPAQP